MVFLGSFNIRETWSHLVYHIGNIYNIQSGWAHTVSSFFYIQMRVYIFGLLGPASQRASNIKSYDDAVFLSSLFVFPFPCYCCTAVILHFSHSNH